MPVDIGAYRRDTAHLGALEHGAYLLLLFHYWVSSNKLPTDDQQLSRIACCTPDEWKRVKPVVSKFFGKGWRGQIRADKELKKAKKISAIRRSVAKESHRKRRANAHAIAEQMQGDANAGQLHMQSSSHLTTYTSHSSQEEPSKPSSTSPLQGKRNGFVGEVVKLKHPRHRAISKDKHFVYLKRGTTEFDAYVADHKEVNGDDPQATTDGRWFPRLGASIGQTKNGKGSRPKIN